MKTFQSRFSLVPWLVGLICLFAADVSLAQTSCLDSLPDPPFLASEPGMPACPVALQPLQGCSCTGAFEYCNSYPPSSRGDDAPAINACLNNKDCKCVQLQPATYRLRSQLLIKSNRMADPKNGQPQNILDGARILGSTAGQTRSRLRAESPSCSFPGDSLDAARQRYAPVIEVSRTLSVTLDGFELDLSDLRESCPGMPTRLGNFAIRMNPNVDDARVTNLTLFGQRFESPGTNSGGGTTGGIFIQTGARSVVQGNVLRDLGFLRGLTPSGGKAGSSGVSSIQIVNSGSSCVARNRLERIGFGIEVVNFAGAGDSSKTQVVGNAVEGAAGLVGCDSCSQGRVIKLQACRDGANGPDPMPLQDLSVRSNKACLFGGLRNKNNEGNLIFEQEGSGIDLICGVQFSSFRSNTLEGRLRNTVASDMKDSAVLFALQFRSQLVDSKTRTFILGYSPKTTTHHNLFENNRVLSGRDGTTCGNECADIRINADAPDQINIGRTTPTSPTPGNNTFNNFLRLDNNTQSCMGSDFSQVKAEQLGPDLSSRIRFTTRGITPNTQVTIHFRQGTADKPFMFTTTACAMTISKRAKKLVEVAGIYTMTADYEDGNSRSGINMDQPVTIQGDRLGTITVGTPTVPPPQVGNLTVSPSALSFTASPGGPNPPSQSLTIGSTLGQLEWEAFSSAPWLTVASSGAFTPGTLTVGVNVGAMPAGTYSASILVNSIDSNEVLIPVTLTLGGGMSASLSVSPTSLSFSGVQGGINPAPQGLSIGSTGAALAWTATDNAAWLTLSPASGSTPSGTMASVNLSGLAAGSYSALVTIASPSTAAVTIPVTLTLSAPPVGGGLTVNPTSFTFTAPAGGPAPAMQQLQIGSTGAPLNWSVADDQPWLSLSPASGTTPGVTTLTINVAGLAAGSYSSTITVSAAGVAPVSVPVSLAITPVAPGAPVVNGFNPISGPPGTAVEIAGPNFATATDVSFNNVSAGRPTLLTNGNLRAVVPATATTGLIRVTNPAGTGESFTPFTVTGMGPTITSINPLSGPRITTSVTIFGANLAGATSVAFGGSPASFTPAGDNFIAATVPAGAPSGSVAVTVTKNGITATSPTSFFVTDPAPAGLTATASLTFSAQVGQPNPASQVFSIDSTVAGTTYNWSLSDSASWLSVSPISGLTPGVAQASVNTSGLSAGTFTATITVSSTNAPNAPITRPVTLNLAPASPSATLTVTPTAISQTVAPGEQPTERTLTINSTAASLAWSVSSSVPWINVATPSGTTPGSTFLSFNTVLFPVGTYTGNIMVSSPGVTTVTVPVTITVGSGGGGGGGGTLAVRVTQPNGGEFFQPGQTISIQWTSTGATSHDIAYSMNGTPFTPIISNYTASPTSFLWRIPVNYAPSQEERSLTIRVTARSSSGTTAQDLSDGFATVFNPF